MRGSTETLGLESEFLLDVKGDSQIQDQSLLISLPVSKKSGKCSEEVSVVGSESG